MQTQRMQFHKFFADGKVSDLIQPDFELVRLNASDNFYDAMWTLCEKSIQSAPVWDAQQNAFIGLVDVLDLLACALKVDVQLPPDTWSDRAAAARTLSDYTVGSIVNASHRDPWVPVFVGLPLTSLLDHFSSGVGFHRVGVVDGDGNVIGLVSQRRLADYVCLNRHRLGRALSTPAADVMSKRPLVTAHVGEKTRDAFQRLIDAGVSGLAVVDDQKQLVGTLSASDLKEATLGGNVWAELQRPLGEHLRQHGKTPVYVTTDAPMDAALTKLAMQAHVHRLWVCDQQQRAVGVLSLYDLLTWIHEIREPDDSSVA